MEKEEGDYCISKSFEEMLRNPDFYSILEELIDFGISRYKENYSRRYQNTDLVLYQKYTYEDACRLLTKSGRSMESEDVQNFLYAKERGIDVQLFGRKNKDDKISKEFYYLGRIYATGEAKKFVMPNTEKTAVEIEWALETPVREDIYEYIVNG